MSQERMPLPCDTCNICTDAEIIATYTVSSIGESAHPDIFDVPVHQTTTYFFAKCPRCGSPLLAEQTYDVDIENDRCDETADPVRLFPATVTVNFDYLSADMEKARREAHANYRVGHYGSSVLMSRRVLELACIKRNAPKKSDLKGKIEFLFKDPDAGILKEWADTVRTLGNDAAHGTDVNITKDNTKNVLDFLDALLMLLFRPKVKHRKTQEKPDEEHDSEPPF